MGVRDTAVPPACLGRAAGTGPIDLAQMNGPFRVCRSHPNRLNIRNYPPLACWQAHPRFGVNGAAARQEELEGSSVVLPGRRRRRCPVNSSELLFTEFEREGA